jgi:hypothetical protein
MKIARCALAAALLAGCTSPASPRTPETSAPPADRCAAPVAAGTLPVWARTGFSGDAPSAPHVLGENGDIVAILFGHPLRQPPDEGRSNKILWVSRAPVDGTPLRIEARHEATGRTARQEVQGGPGPSIVDLPAPGCWTVTLTWAGHRDTMALRYLGATGDR